MKRIIAILLILGTTTLAHARFMKSWSYQELYDQSDLVVIAKPISTRDTTEKTTLRDISPPERVVGLSTEFDIRLVLKGDKSKQKMTLHHYQRDSTEPIINGPMLAYFDPKLPSCFLLFLRREADGRYAPVSGQTDPAGVSIVKLEECSD